MNEEEAKNLLPKKASRGAKKNQSKNGYSQKVLRSNFETEDAPKIPKLNLGKIQTSSKPDYFTKNISEYDDTSLGDFEMILRN